MYSQEHQSEPGRHESSISARQSPFGDRKLIVVSNREPYRHKRSEEDDSITVDRPTGGLTAGLDPVMQRTGGTWIAWGDGDADADVVDGSNRVAVPPEEPQYTLRRLWLSDDQVENYYYGFSNRVMWPICHSALSTAQSRPEYWHQYRRTNEQFAEAVAAEADEESIIWFQDYHFALAPGQVRRELGRDHVLMQFWHVPWPGWDVFRACPHSRELLQGLLGNDLLAFHVQRFCDNFLECVEAGLQEATVDWRTSTVSYQGEVTHVEPIPMGVPFDDIRYTAASYNSTDFESFRETHGIDQDTKIAVGVDRLDYSKGIPERLRALERLWERFPAWRGSLTFVQNGTESRSQIGAYKREQERIDDLADGINDRYGTEDWQPIIRVSEHLSRKELYGLYRHSDVGIVSPIRDGMNLVAQEYVAAQVEADGVLVLSTQAGIHDIVGKDAVSVSPYEVDGFADQLNWALTMPHSERRSRMVHLRRRVADNDLQSWLRLNTETVRTLLQQRSQTLQHDVS